MTPPESPQPLDEETLVTRLLAALRGEPLTLAEGRALIATLAARIAQHAAGDTPDPIALRIRAATRDGEELLALLLELVATLQDNPIARLRLLRHLADHAWGHFPDTVGYRDAVRIRARTENGRTLETWAHEVAASTPSPEVRSDALALADLIVERRGAWDQVMGPLSDASPAAG